VQRRSADLCLLSIDVIPRPDELLLLLLFVIKAVGIGRRLGLCVEYVNDSEVAGDEREK
jgi:hypothetical protein